MVRGRPRRGSGSNCGPHPQHDRMTKAAQIWKIQLPKSQWHDASRDVFREICSRFKTSPVQQSFSYEVMSDKANSDTSNFSFRFRISASSFGAKHKTPRSIKSNLKTNSALIFLSPSWQVAIFGAWVQPPCSPSLLILSSSSFLPSIYSRPTYTTAVYSVFGFFLVPFIRWSPPPHTPSPPRPLPPILWPILAAGPAFTLARAPPAASPDAGDVDNSEELVGVVKTKNDEEEVKENEEEEEGEMEDGEEEGVEDPTSSFGHGLMSWPRCPACGNLEHPRRRARYRRYSSRYLRLAQPLGSPPPLLPPVVLLGPRQFGGAGVSGNDQRERGGGKPNLEFWARTDELAALPSFALARAPPAASPDSGEEEEVEDPTSSFGHGLMIWPRCPVCGNLEQFDMEEESDQRRRPRLLTHPSSVLVWGIEAVPNHAGRRTRTTARNRSLVIIPLSADSLQLGPDLGSGCSGEELVRTEPDDLTRKRSRL
ncbi:hypothetical protein V8F20_001832 [Naviculisporaceae sp. PSN 640]